MPDLEWKRNTHDGTEYAYSTLGTYRIRFTGWDFVVTRNDNTIGRTLSWQTARSIAADDYAIAQIPAPAPTVPDGPPDKIAQIVMAIYNEVGFVDGTNALREITLGLAKGLNEAGMRLTPRGDTR